MAVPLVIALPPLWWIVDGTRRASVTPLGRDQGIFQYVAWAIAHGARDYRDVRDVNGPLTHLVHFVFLKLGGGDEHRFRVLDLIVTAIAFAVVGACIPGIGRAMHRRTGARPRAASWLERGAWALAAWVALSGQYLAFVYWDTAQRESFFDWFVLAGVGVQLVGQGRSRGRDRELANDLGRDHELANDLGRDHELANDLARSAAKRATWCIAAAGALSIVPWFGKPTYALFTLAQLAALAVDRDAPLPRARALRAFAIGAAIGAASQLAFLFAYGDAGAYLRIALSDVPTSYRFIWARSAADIFSGPWYADRAIFGVVGAVVMGALIALGRMPARALAVALLPLAAIVNVVVQAKGFPYHFHPLTAAVYLQWLVFAAWLWERAPKQRVFALVFAAAVALRVATEMAESPYLKEVWLIDGAATTEQRATKEYFARFHEDDFFPWDLREAAAFLRERTAPTDRVQHYGMDPYVLFLAGRLSATPYIYSYDLNADAALGGGTGSKPNDAQRAQIRAIRDEHERDLLERLRAAPPAAFVFVDKSPLISEVDAYKDFERHCPDAARWIAERYREEGTFGVVHVWMRTIP